MGKDDVVLVKKKVVFLFYRENVIFFWRKIHDFEILTKKRNFADLVKKYDFQVV